MSNGERNYGMMSVPPAYRKRAMVWSSWAAVRHLNEEERVHFLRIIDELSDPEHSRLTSNTDNFDCLEMYYYDYILSYNKRLKNDAVYGLLTTAIRVFADYEAYEICFNIRRALRWLCKKDKEYSKTSVYF